MRLRVNKLASSLRGLLQRKLLSQDPIPARYLILRALDRRFGIVKTYQRKLDYGTIERAHYGHCMLQSAMLARKLGHSRISCIEFGVAGGAGLVAMERHAEAVRVDPKNYALWVEGMTTYHLMVEGILALVGQRLILRLLRNLDLMPAFRSGFTAVTRDESRHVNYGIWALRRAVEDGEEASIRVAVDRCLRPCLRIYVNPERLIDIPKDLPAGARVDPRNNWNFAVDSVSKRLRAAGVDSGYIGDVAERSWQIIWEAVAEYEKVHAQEHPVRAWERGEWEAKTAV